MHSSSLTQQSLEGCDAIRLARNGLLDDLEIDYTAAPASKAQAENSPRSLIIFVFPAFISLRFGAA